MSGNMRFTMPAKGGASHQGFLAASAGGRLPLVQKTYGLLLASILVAIGAGFVVMHTPQVLVSTFDGRALTVPSGVLAMDRLGFVIWVALFAMLLLGRRLAMMPGINVAFLFAFTGICGAWVTPVIYEYGALRGQPQVVGMAGALTGIMFLSLSAVAYLSKKDFSFLAAGLAVAMIGIIAASLLNAFVFRSSWGFTMLSWAVLVVSSGYILARTSFMLRHMEEEHAVLMAIGLFVDLLNLFLVLLRLLGGGRR